jgi:hypothetical protein
MGRNVSRTFSVGPWKAFRRHYVQDLVSLDFFVVPTVTHKVLFALIILANDQRRVVPFNVTEHPTAQEARRFLSALKERLKEALPQEEILIVERQVETR